MKPLQEWKQRIALAWAILKDEDDNFVGHAKRELQSAYESGDDMNIRMADHLIDMARLFSVEGHSGFSASYATSALNKLLKFEPLDPLYGIDSEWIEVGEQNGQPLYQNNRCGRVFKEGNFAYDIDGAVFREPNGACFTSKHSRVPVIFPYTPKTVYVDIPENATDTQRSMLVNQALAAS